MKMKIFGITALVCVFILTGCPTEDDPASMTFFRYAVDPSDAIGKEFTINEDLEFTVNFLIIAPSPSVESLSGLKPGDTVSGKIIDILEPSNARWDGNFTGEAGQMSSSNTTINGMLGTLNVPLSLTYEKTDGVINAVTLAFGNHSLAAAAQDLLGGTFIRKQ